MPVVPVGICAMSYTKLFFRRCTKGSEKALPWNLLNPWTVFLQFVTTCGKHHCKTSIQNPCAPENGFNECDVCCTHDYHWAGSYTVHYANTCPLLRHKKPTWLFAAAPIDRFRGPKETHALKTENTIQLTPLQQFGRRCGFMWGRLMAAIKMVFGLEDDDFTSW